MDKKQILTKIEKEIDNIPPIPDNIEKIKTLIQDPKSTVQQISTLIKLDPGLTADILRIANSAMYKSRTRAETVERSLTVIGMKELSNIVVSIAAKKILTEHFPLMQEIWDHSIKCAFYAQHLTKLQNMHFIKDIAYTAGLLHDIGKLVLITIFPGISDRIHSLSEARHLAPSEIEKLAIGLTHGEIGAKITDHWNFPETLVSSIAYHHAPILATEEDRPLVYIVYLANILSQVEEVQADLMVSIEPKVLDYFKIETEEALDLIIQSSAANYETLNELL